MSIFSPSTGFPKIVTQNSFEWGPFVDTLSTIVDDPQVFRKVAGSRVVHDWGSVQPIKNHTLIHIIALGDFEKVGSNRNMDAFEEWFNIKSHPTFAKHAKLYEGHRICDPSDPAKDVSKGFVAKTAHNDEMGRVELLIAANHDKCAHWLESFERGEPQAFSMGFNCIFSGQLVNTKERGLSPIEDVKIGDHVISSSGSWKRVLNHFINDLAGRRKVTVRCTGAIEPLEVTTDHPVYVVRRERVRSKSGHLRVSPEWEYEEVMAETLHEGDYLVRPIRSFTGTSSPGVDLAYVAGMYIGDGHIGRNDGEIGGAVHITLNRADRSILRKLIDICFRNEWQFSVDYSKVAKAVLFRIRDIPVTEYCKTFGIAKRKRCPDGIFEWSKEDALSFLAGYHDADGSASGEMFRFSTVLPEIAYTVNEVALACGLPMSIWKDYIGSNANSFAVASYAYVGLIPRSCLAPLRPFSVKISENFANDPERGHKIRFFDQEGLQFAALPIKEISIEESKDEIVYCLEVDQDHNFVVSGVLVHNCYFDECSQCGFKAKKPEFYCEHVRKNAKAPYGPGQILPDGSKCFVFNRAGFWNDISKVGVGADMTAFDLRKVASLAEEAGRVLSGAELGAMYVRKEGPIDMRYLLAQKLASTERDVLNLGFPAIFGVVSSRTVSQKVATALVSAPTPGDVYGYLCDRNIVLPPREFFKVAMPFDAIAYKDDIDVIEQKFLKEGSFAWAEQQGYLSQICLNHSYTPKRASRASLDPASESTLVRDFSQNREFSRLRDSENAVKIACLMNNESQTQQLSPKQAALACEYLSYRLSAIEN